MIVVEIKKIGDINLVELYHGPTLAFKDVAMQVIGNMYDELKLSSEKKINIVVATSGDTGSAAISALNDRKNINVFVLHPHNKISHIQRKIMTAVDSKNIYNIVYFRQRNLFTFSIDWWIVCINRKLTKYEQQR